MDNAPLFIYVFEHFIFEDDGLWVVIASSPQEVVEIVRKEFTDDINFMLEEWQEDDLDARVLEIIGNYHCYPLADCSAKKGVVRHFISS